MLIAPRREREAKIPVRMRPRHVKTGQAPTVRSSAAHFFPSDRNAHSVWPGTNDADSAITIARFSGLMSSRHGNRHASRPAALAIPNLASAPPRRAEPLPTAGFRPAGFPRQGFVRMAKPLCSRFTSASSVGVLGRNFCAGAPSTFCKAPQRLAPVCIKHGIRDQRPWRWPKKSGIRGSGSSQLCACFLCRRPIPSACCGRSFVPLLGRPPCLAWQLPVPLHRGEPAWSPAPMEPAIQTGLIATPSGHWAAVFGGSTKKPRNPAEPALPPQMAVCPDHRLRARYSFRSFEPLAPAIKPRPAFQSRVRRAFFPLPLPGCAWGFFSCRPGPAAAILGHCALGCRAPHEPDPSRLGPILGWDKEFDSAWVLSGDLDDPRSPSKSRGPRFQAAKCAPTAQAFAPANQVPGRRWHRQKTRQRAPAPRASCRQKGNLHKTEFRGLRRPLPSSPLLAFTLKGGCSYKVSGVRNFPEDGFFWAKIRRMGAFGENPENGFRIQFPCPESGS